MGLSESQLETWSNQGATTNSQKTYASIKSALEAYRWPDEFAYETYLQGSYRNSTNTRGNSDVDVVTQLTSSFLFSLSDLTESQQRAFHASYPSASHGWTEFRAHLEKALVSYYGSDRVKPGKKCITVQTPYLEADVLACQSYRDYDQSFQTSAYSFGYGEGITFWVPSEGRWVVNFPKLHYSKGTEKNSRTWQSFKPMVRCFKNARWHLVENGVVSAGLAPSYFVECLLYNMPDRVFSGSKQDQFVAILNELLGADKSKYVSQSGRTWLFGPTPEQWDVSSADRLVTALVGLWNS